MSKTFVIEQDKAYKHRLFLEDRRVNIANQPVTLQKKAVVPALVLPKGQSSKALIKGEWIVGESRVATIPYLWGNGSETLWIGLPDGYYCTHRSMIVSCSREKVVFQDGSCLEGDFALYLWAALEEKDKGRLYFKIVAESNGVTTFDTDPYD